MQWEYYVKDFITILDVLGLFQVKKVRKDEICIMRNFHDFSRFVYLKSFLETNLYLSALIQPLNNDHSLHKELLFGNFHGLEKLCSLITFVESVVV